MDDLPISRFFIYLTTAEALLASNSCKQTPPIREHQPEFQDAVYFPPLVKWVPPLWQIQGGEGLWLWLGG